MSYQAEHIAKLKQRLEDSLSHLEQQVEKQVQQCRFDHAIREKAVKELEHYISEVSKIVKSHE
jgi:hypothetical protein